MLILLQENPPLEARKSKKAEIQSHIKNFRERKGKTISNQFYCQHYIEEYMKKNEFNISIDGCNNYCENILIIYDRNHC